jgi:hypothetical protein
MSYPDENKEFVSVYVDKKIAKELKDLEGSEEQEKIVKDIIKRKKLDLENENDLLSDNVLIFKNVCLEHRNQLKKIYADEDAKLEEMFLELDATRSKFKKTSKDLQSAIRPLSDELDQCREKFKHLKDGIDGLNIYGSEKLVEFARTIQNMDDATKDIFGFILNHYKKENKR